MTNEILSEYEVDFLIKDVRCDKERSAGSTLATLVKALKTIQHYKEQAEALAARENMFREAVRTIQDMDEEELLTDSYEFCEKALSSTPTQSLEVARAEREFHEASTEAIYACSELIWQDKETNMIGMRGGEAYHAHAVQKALDKLQSIKGDR